jgi:hypothetical protein
MQANHAHPMVSKSQIASLNERYAPWQICKAWVPGSRVGGFRGYFETQARNTETGEVIYRCQGWSQASRGQALNAILARRFEDSGRHPQVSEDAGTAVYDNDGCAGALIPEIIASATRAADNAGVPETTDDGYPIPAQARATIAALVAMDRDYGYGPVSLSTARYGDAGLALTVCIISTDSPADNPVRRVWQDGNSHIVGSNEDYSRWCEVLGTRVAIEREDDAAFIIAPGGMFARFSSGILPSWVFASLTGR